LTVTGLESDSVPVASLHFIDIQQMARSYAAHARDASKEKEREREREIR